MKKHLISVISVILSAVFIVLSFSGCSGIKEKTVITYKTQSLSDAIYKYLCSIEKTNLLYEIYGVSTDSTAASSLQDDPKIWTMTASDGTTVADTLRDSVLNKMKLTVYFAQYALDNGYEMNDEIRKSMQSQLDEIASAFPDKKTFNEAIGQYGVNYDILYDYYMLMGLSSLGNYILFGENGKQVITEDSAKKYFNENYLTIASVFINTKNKTYPNGKTVYLPDSEKEEKIKLAEEVYETALCSEDFTELIKTYSDTVPAEPEKGTTFTSGTFGNEDVEKAAKEMKNGEIRKIESEEGIYIIKKLPLNSAYFANSKGAIVTYLEDTAKAKLIKDNEQGFIIDTETLNSIDIASIPHAQ